MTGRFTGRHMAIVLVCGFGVVIVVNLLMATLAVRGFGGVVVENSYVASQKFNSWLARAEAQNALGWQAQITRNGDGRLEVATTAPAGTRISAQLRRPVGDPTLVNWALLPVPGGRFISNDRLPEGRWLVRVTLANGGDRMRIERPLG